MSKESVEQYIEKHPKNIQEITVNLRQLILNTSSEWTEEIKWGMPSYSINKNICYLQASKNHVNLGFYHGAQLEDPHNLLGGTGKQMRHIRVKKMEDIDEDSLKLYVKNAIQLDQS
ncbi:DUF1801 domain-containing protein [Gracilibacillus kekensis]|uniref:YdhG-like domain-containing protein n=1 Tax=Gracilibacillus kekensis TaxID=1027249 RepID=A0A1M7QGX3_9BACI|nr:DUF1801 domain-containing protein [Gracilibacillus kekensis]SHN30352.1 hypothetical protein SAMN05216179_3167 [Gracilibacillus kekensis]